MVLYANGLAADTDGSQGAILALLFLNAESRRGFHFDQGGPINLEVWFVAFQSQTPTRAPWQM